VTNSKFQQITLLRFLNTALSHKNSIYLYSCDLVWDPTKAREKGLLALAKVDYDKAAFQTLELKPEDGSDWTPAQEEMFRNNIFRLRRDLPAVARLMKLPVNACHAYYLGRYKNTLSYRILKTVCIEERENKAEDSDRNEDACAVCGDGGSLLICDGCEKEYHMKCLTPALASVPEGRWECDECLDRQIIRAQERIMSSSKLFEKVKVDSQKSNKGRFDDSEAAEKFEYRPVPLAIEATRALCLKLQEIFAQTGNK
jgi:PHD-finger